jgi:hypothetical protein
VNQGLQQRYDVAMFSILAKPEGADRPLVKNMLTLSIFVLLLSMLLLQLQVLSVDVIDVVTVVAGVEC